MAGKIKVTGYAQRTFFDNGIEYRNFADDLVGFQLTSNGGTPIFTSGNFAITTNIDTKPSKIFTGKSFSKFLKLEDLQMTQTQVSEIIEANKLVKLNLDKSNLTYYALFGSLSEFIRVSLENIIINWPASIYLTKYYFADPLTTGYTIDNHVYDATTNTSTFSVNTSLVRNPYEINYLTNGQIINTFNETNDLRNMAVNYANYSVSASTGEFDVVDFTGATSLTGDYMYFKVTGAVLTGSNTTEKIHIKPNKSKIDEFFYKLPDFEANLLNRMTFPKYTSSYSYTSELESGAIIELEQVLTWPVTDGYNLDYVTPEYVTFATDLLDLATSNDLTKTDLITRQLTSDSISDFDTCPDCDGVTQETAGQKVSKTLKIYGREFDEIKRFIDGMAFANTVTYNKKNNTPDIVLKDLARVLGWDLVSSVIDNDLLNAFMNTADPSYSGQSAGLTPAQAEAELWRRIILNTPWIWKSKGTRKAVEFIIRFIGTPAGLIEFNEYIYKAKNNLDIDLFQEVLFQTYNTTSLDGLNIDSEGYPRVLPDTEDMYFQKAGLWYRQTGGPSAHIDILEGNNPHVGPYDRGQEYIDQFGCLIPDFEPVTVMNETISTGRTNIFTNYNSGFVNNATEPEVYASVYNLSNVPLDDCYELTKNFIDDPKPTDEFTNCGCTTPEEDDAIQISIRKIPAESASNTPADCGYSAFTLDDSGFVVFNQTNSYPTTVISQECCEALGYTYAGAQEPSCYWDDTKAPSDTKEGVGDGVGTDGGAGTGGVTTDRDKGGEFTGGGTGSEGIGDSSDPCNTYQIAGVQNSGLVTWTSSVLQQSTTVVSLECCNAYGFLGEQVQGGYQCYQQSNDCADYTRLYEQQGVVVWELYELETNQYYTTQIVPKACCDALGSVYVYNGSKCIKNEVQDADQGLSF